jgi:16S rRNA (guanine527-N7)-methyltransferase
MDRRAFAEALEGLGIVPSDPLADAFEEFEVELYRANETRNLTRVPREEAWLRHFVDSLLIHPLLPEGSDVLDIGTGPGFPAWPLACARPDLRVTALDSSGKMLGFLRSQPLPNLTAVQARAEEWGVREAFDAVTGRALAPLPIQLELSAAPCRVDGIVLPMRTPAESFDLAAFRELGLQLERVELAPLPGTDVMRALPIYRKVAKTPSAFPRKWADMKSRPLG